MAAFSLQITLVKSRNFRYENSLSSSIYVVHFPNRKLFIGFRLKRALLILFFVYHRLYIADKSNRWKLLILQFYVYSMPCDANASQHLVV